MLVTFHIIRCDCRWCRPGSGSRERRSASFERSRLTASGIFTAGGQRPFRRMGALIDASGLTCVERAHRDHPWKQGAKSIPV